MASGGGYACALFAALFYGLQYTPVKAYPVYDGSKFQFFMSCGIAFSGLVAALLSCDEHLVLLTHGLVGGILWGTANILVLPTVKFLGLGVGFALYHSINMAVGYSIGRFGLFGAPVEVAANPGLRDSGLGLLLVSLVCMIFVEPEIEDPEDHLDDDDDGSPLPPSSVEKNFKAGKRSSAAAAAALRGASVASSRKRQHNEKVRRSGSMNQFGREADVESTDEARAVKSKMDLLLDAAMLKRRSTDSGSSFGFGRDSLASKKKTPSLPGKRPPRALSVDQLDELSVNAGARMARKAYSNWRRGAPRGSVERSSGVVGAKQMTTRQLVARRAAASRELWPLFNPKDKASVRSRYRSMLSSVDADNRGLIAATLRAVSASLVTRRRPPHQRRQQQQQQQLRGRGGPFDSRSSSSSSRAAEDPLVQKKKIRGLATTTTTTTPPWETDRLLRPPPDVEDGLPSEEEHHHQQRRWSLPGDVPPDAYGGALDSVDRSAQTLAALAAEDASLAKRQRFVVGGLCGGVAGVLCGVNMLPYILFLAKHEGDDGADASSWTMTVSYVFSQTIGVFLAATACLALFALAARLLDIDLKSPAIWPAWLAGTLWTAGFYLAAIAVKDLGMAQAYTYDAIGPVMVSAVVSFTCGEIVGALNTSLFLVALALQAAGVLAIAFGA